MATFVVTKLDKRHSGFSKFKYSVRPVDHNLYNSRLHINEWRTWCWEIFGPSMERDWALSLAYTNKIPLPNWCWETHHNNKIYLRSDEELTLFTLKFAS